MSAAQAGLSGERQSYVPQTGFPAVPPMPAHHLVNSARSTRCSGISAVSDTVAPPKRTNKQASRPGSALRRRNPDRREASMLGIPQTDRSRGRWNTLAPQPNCPSRKLLRTALMSPSLQSQDDTRDGRLVRTAIPSLGDLMDEALVQLGYKPYYGSNQR